MSTRSRTLRFKLLLAGALLVVVAWCVLWFVAATIVDRQVDRAILAAGQAGTVADCVGRRVTGFPFRIELRCDDGTHVARGSSGGEVDGLTVAALVYNPSRIIAEVAGPVTLHAEGAPDIWADWNLAHASARLDLGNAKMERLDVEVVDADVKVGALALDAAEMDINLRRHPVDADALDFALRLREAHLPGDKTPLTVTLTGVLTEGATLLAGDPEPLLAALIQGNAPVAIDVARIEHGDLVLEAGGEIVVNADGHLDGRFDVAIAGHEKGVPMISTLLHMPRDAGSMLLSQLLASAPETEIGGRKAKRVTLHLKDGGLTVGKFPLPLLTVPAVIAAPR